MKEGGEKRVCVRNTSSAIVRLIPTKMELSYGELGTLLLFLPLQSSLAEVNITCLGQALYSHFAFCAFSPGICIVRRPPIFVYAHWCEGADFILFAFFLPFSAGVVGIYGKRVYSS